jgi:hypothetical protein
MSMLEDIAAVLNQEDVFCGYQPDKPDTCTTLYEYPAEPPEHSFGGTDFVYGVQVRTRALIASEAEALTESAASKLNHYHDAEISVIQTTPILDIGRDGANPQRQEYTVNFTIRRF